MTSDNHRKYGNYYKKLRKSLLSSNPICYWCRLVPATTMDHDPPLAAFPSPELWQGILRPSCGHCNYSRGAKFGNKRKKMRASTRRW